MKISKWEDLNNFIEPPKLRRREWLFVNYLPEEYWIARDSGGGIYSYSREPHKCGSTWNDGCYSRCYNRIIDTLFPFITPDRAWSVKELRELEVEDERD